MSLTTGNQAIKIPAGLFSNADKEKILDTKEMFVYSKMLNYCEDNLKKLSVANGLDVLEYNVLFSSQCKQYEDSFYSALRKKYREKYYDEQKKEYFMPTGEIYHPYNPYLQKYHGGYLRNYQEF